ncbi:alpha/beta-hydrolase [Aspergillus karnatakaensis]|uniref:hydrolase psoB n=1 Tax=Aspergillus karnatakaensis TaxID=1810916 RepID=UPI003CCD1018
MHTFSPSNWLNFEILRILATTPLAGAETEFLSAISHISTRSATFEPSWRAAWDAQAARAEKTALRCFEVGNKILARNAFLRAANYVRASGYMLTSPPAQKEEDKAGAGAGGMKAGRDSAGSGSSRTQHPLALPIAERAVALFKRGIKLFDGQVIVLEIPYPGGVLLPGYLYLPPPWRRIAEATEHSTETEAPPARGKIPLLITCGGADSTQEELYTLHPSMATEMGYACLTFDGPGQGLVLRRDNLPLRADFEYVLRHVLDFLTRYSSENPHLMLDLDRVAVSGAALGGYFALRAASDPRIKACIALDPVYDLFEFGTRHVAPFLLRAWVDGWVGDGVVDFVINLGMRWSVQMNWEVCTAGTFLGVGSPTGVLKAMKVFTLKEDILKKVTCPTLVSGARNSLYLDVEGHTGMVWRGLKHLGERRRLWVAEGVEEGSLQAKMGAFSVGNEKTFAFLDEIFGVRREVLEC